MASNFNDPSFQDTSWSLKRPAQSDRWPLVVTLCLSVGLSALLWVSLFNVLGAFD